jgi:hypothetical protein
MRYYSKKGTEKDQSVQGRHFWLAITSFAPGATIQVDDGQVIPISGNWVLRPPTHLSIVTPWHTLTTTGAVTLLVGENHEPPPPNAGQLVQQIPTALIASDVIICPDATPTLLVASGVAVRSVMVQNHGAKPLTLSEVVNPTLAGGAGSKILAVLAACAVAYDGSGGSIVLDGLSDSLYGAGRGASCDVSVNVW